MKHSVAILLLLLGLPALAMGTVYTFDPAHSAASFSVKHLMITNVKGTFSDISGRMTFDDTVPEKTTFDAKIQVASIDTGIQKRDDHLRSSDFFDATTHPHITFRSTGLKKLGPALYTLTGQLTMRGVEKTVELSLEGLDQVVKDPWGNIKRGVRITGTIDRRDFGMTWNKAIETGGVVVGNEVRIEVELELQRQ